MAGERDWGEDLFDDAEPVIAPRVQMKPAGRHFSKAVAREGDAEGKDPTAREADEPRADERSSDASLPADAAPQPSPRRRVAEPGPFSDEAPVPAGTSAQPSASEPIEPWRPAAAPSPSPFDTQQFIMAARRRDGETASASTRPAAPASPDSTLAFIAAASASSAAHPRSAAGSAAPAGAQPSAKMRTASAPDSTSAFMAAASAVSGPSSAAVSSSAAPSSSPDASPSAAVTASIAAPPRAAASPVPASARPVVSRVPAGSAAGAVLPRTPAGRHPAGSASPEPPRRRRRNILPIVLIVVGVVLLLTAAGLFIRAQLGYREAKAAYDDISKAAVSDTSGDGIPNIDFDALAAESEDIVGWIYVPGTPISYPVLQGVDNNQYLRHLPNGEWNDNGSIFMDMDDTAPGVVDQQTTLYGHHTNDGSMFKAIDGTLQQDAFDDIDKVYYITRDATYTFKPLFTAQVQDDYGDARVANFADDAAFTKYLQDTYAQAKAKAADAEERIPNTKQVLTLVTCAGEIIPRTTRAAMVCTLEETTARE